MSHWNVAINFIVSIVTISIGYRYEINWGKMIDLEKKADFPIWKTVYLVILLQYNRLNAGSSQAANKQNIIYLLITHFVSQEQKKVVRRFVQF